MRRISSLPIAEYCPKATTIAKGVESSNSLRSSIFHKYCETGQWPDASLIDEKDLDEIKQWNVPKKFILERMGESFELDYEKAVKEHRVTLGEGMKLIDTPQGLSPSDVDKLYPEARSSGSFDMGYHFTEHKLVVVEDIKSSVFAVRSRTESLQLHAYGIGYALEKGAERYVVGIWDASQGMHYFGDVVELDSFEYEEYCTRIERASTNESENFIKGSHCSQCWVRSNCPAHLDGTPEQEAYKALRPGAKESEVRLALVEAKRLEDQSEKLKDAVKAWINLHGHIKSEDGSQQYGPILSGGRKSLDKEAVKRALGVKDLSKFQKKGKDISSFRWVNRK